MNSSDRDPKSARIRREAIAASMLEKARMDKIIRTPLFGTGLAFFLSFPTSDKLEIQITYNRPMDELTGSSVQEYVFFRVRRNSRDKSHIIDYYSPIVYNRKNIPLC